MIGDEAMTGRQLQEYLQTLTPEELEMPVFMSTCCDFNAPKQAYIDRGNIILDDHLDDE